MTREQTVSRARLCIGKDITYKLGHGGEDPSSKLPCDKDGLLDCSGFALWSLGVSRTVRIGHPWRDLFPPLMEHGRPMPYGLDTSRIRNDARTTLKAFRQVYNAQPGDLFVYGDYRDQFERMRQGHVAVISAVSNGYPTAIIHCSASNRPDAVAETSVADFWQARGALIAAPIMFDPKEG